MFGLAALSLATPVIKRTVPIDGYLTGLQSSSKLLRIRDYNSFLRVARTLFGRASPSQHP